MMMTSPTRVRAVLSIVALALAATSAPARAKPSAPSGPGATVTAAVKPEGLIDAANQGPSSTSVVADPRAAVALAEVPVVEEPAAAAAPRPKRHAPKKQVETDIPY